MLETADVRGIGTAFADRLETARNPQVKRFFRSQRPDDQSPATDPVQKMWVVVVCHCGSSRRSA